MKVIYILPVFALLMMACLDNDSMQTYDENLEQIRLQAEVDDQIIQDYIESTGLIATEDSSGVYYVISDTGVGGHPNSYSNVEISYKGYLTDSTVFEEDTLNYPLYNLIYGFQIGVPYFQKGGRGTLLIPSRWGYGSNAIAGQANAVIVFDIELLDFK